MSWAEQNEDFVRRVQRHLGVDDDGCAGDVTRCIFEEELGAEPTGIPGFSGWIWLLQSFEAHVGEPYWPEGDSGVTVDPGVDLGYVDPALVESVYPALVDKLRPAFGVRGRDASHLLRRSHRLQSVRISRRAAEKALPLVATPYWAQISRRFPAVRTAPARVQTAMVSLAYNRGAYNPDLAALRGPLASGDWQQAGDLVAAMQQDHKLLGVRTRRQREGRLIASVVPTA